MKIYFLIICMLLFLFSCQQQSTVKDVAKNDAEVSKINTNTEDKKTNKKILFFGDSLTAGYQLNEEESFPSLIQEKINSAGLPFEVINAGLSGETTAGGLNRIDWVLNQNIDIFVLELGANDVLRGFDLSSTESNLEGIIEKVIKKDKDIEIILAGMLAPPNMGKEYGEQFKSMFEQIANKYDIDLVPFLLQDVAGIPELNLPDGVHPNAEGQKVVMKNVWAVLKEYL